MMQPIVCDGFVRDPHELRSRALSLEFIDWEAPDGEVYKRISIQHVPEVQSKIERVMGCPVEMLGMGFRLNYGGEVPNAAIHSDIGWGTHALVLYLSDSPGGTAFWQHKATGARRIEQGDTALFEQVRGDWDCADCWDQVGLCKQKFNRGVIYESALFHSRWPFEASGTGPDDGRLILVAFFTPED